MLSAPAIRMWFASQDWETDAAVAGWNQHCRARWAWRKLRKARRWARVFARVPGVRMIAVGNALGYGNCREESDIDLVIVTAPRRIWTARLLVVALLKLFRQRPGEHTRDALCPSFFLTTDTLNLEPLQLSVRTSSFDIRHSSFPPDPYLLFWPTQLTVLYDRDDTYAQLWDANAVWVRRWLPDAAPRGEHARFAWRRKPTTQFWTVVQNCVMRFLRPLGLLAERWAKRAQEPHLRRMFPYANSDTSVVIRDDILKFHTNDRRAEFRERWVVRLQEHGETSAKVIIASPRSNLTRSN